MPVGRVGRPHGIDGSFVVEHGSKDERRFAVGAVVLVDGQPAKVVSSKRAGGARQAIRLDREAPRGATLAVRRDELPEPEEDAFSSSSESFAAPGNTSFTVPRLRPSESSTSSPTSWKT